MGSEKWLQELIKKLEERIGAEYQITEVEQRVPGMGGEARVGIMKNGERTGILLELDPGKVQQLKKGNGLEETADTLAEQYLQKRDALLGELLAGEDFALMKERVIFALERKKGNEEALSRIPWEAYLDMVMVFYLMENPGGDTYYRAVSNRDLEAWKVSKEEIRRIAWENTPKLCAPLLLTAEDAVKGNREGRQMSMTDIKGYLLQNSGTEMQAFVLTNQYGFYGASVILYDGLLEQIAWVWRDDVLVLPISINEVMIVPSCGSGSTRTIREWREMVREMNQEEDQKEMALSDSVYFYDHRKGKLCIATDDYKRIFD